MDKAKMKDTITQGVQNFIDMATESELRVLGELVGLQVFKACFVRRAVELGWSAEQVAACQQDIEEKSRQVQALVKLLDECDANAIQAVRAPKH